MVESIRCISNSSFRIEVPTSKNTDIMKLEQLITVQRIK